jgi:hypothetical protein
MKKVTLSVLSILCLSVAFAAAQPIQDNKPAADKPAATLPTLDQIIDRDIAASGGKTAIEKITSRVSKGTFDAAAMGLSGPSEQYSKAPNKSYISIDLGVALYKRGFDGAKGWVLDPQAGLRDLTPGEVAESKIDEDFFLPLKLKELYSKLEVKDKVKVGERDAYLVEASTGKGKPDKLYYDVQTGLLIRKDIERESSQGPIESQLVFEDFREVDGVKVPFLFKQSNPFITFTIKLTEVKHNVTIDDSKFAKPSQ